MTAVQCTLPGPVFGGRTAPMVQPAAGLPQALAEQANLDAYNKTITFILEGSTDSITLTLGELACRLGAHLMPANVDADPSLFGMGWTHLSRAVTGNEDSDDSMKQSNGNAVSPVTAQSILFQNQYRLYTTRSRGGQLGDMLVVVTREVYDKIRARQAALETPGPVALEPGPSISVTGTLKPGEMRDIIILGTNTSFDDTTRIEIEPVSGIAEISRTLNDQELTVRIRVAAGAGSGTRTLRVITGEQTLEGSVTIERGAVVRREPAPVAPGPARPAPAADPCARFSANLSLLQACKSRNP